MSGIAGIIHFDGKPVALGQIESMTAAMHYRGPDGTNHWRKGNVALGQCMLRTTPESLEENQPLTNEDETLVLVMDGRVDNWEELRRELLGKGAVLRTRADAELVLRAYEVWGRDCLAHIDGDFALVIWDARKQEAFCARDRIGNKSFHYHWVANTLVFATELHPILGLPWVERRPNEGMLAEFLAWDIDSLDETLWVNIYRLKPAHDMVVVCGNVQTRQYWTPDKKAQQPFSRDEDYFERYLELLTDSVRRLSRSHCSVGCEVSGGLDSSALYCVADKLRRGGRLPTPSLQGYTLAFSGQDAANELVYARAVGEYLGVTIHEIPPSIMSLEWYQTMAQEKRDLAAFPNGAMSVNLWGRASQDGCRVVLNGVGGDEWLTGSPVYYAEELRKFEIGHVIKCFKADSAVFGFKQALFWLIRYGFFELMPELFQSGIKTLFGRGRGAPYWLSPEFVRLLASRGRNARYMRCSRVERVGQKQLFAMLNNGFRVVSGEMAERLIARSMLEVRRPFNAVSLVEFALSTPERLRLAGGVNKYLHVKALGGVLPPQISRRQTKAEFSSVFRLHLDQMHATAESISARRLGWLSAKGMNPLYETYAEFPEKGLPLWVLWTLFLCDGAMI